MSRGQKIAGVALVLVLVLAPIAGIVIPLLRYAPPQFGAVLPGGAVLADGGGSNVYILRDGPSHVALVDCGMDPRMQGVAAALRKFGLGLNAVEAVLITHAHPDHIGGCAAVPGAKLYALDREAAAIAGREIVPSPLSTITLAKPKATGLNLTLGLSDGDAFTMGTLAITVYAVPGHTPGSAAYLIGPALFVGDAAGFSKGGSVVGSPWIFNSDNGQMAASRRALAASLAFANVEIVATGHTAPGQLKALE